MLKSMQDSIERLLCRDWRGESSGCTTHKYCIVIRSSDSDMWIHRNEDSRTKFDPHVQSEDYQMLASPRAGCSRTTNMSIRLEILVRLLNKSSGLAALYLHGPAWIAALGASCVVFSTASKLYQAFQQQLNTKTLTYSRYRSSMFGK